jgi:hypothetical protein
MRPALPIYPNQSRSQQQQKENCSLIFLMNIDAENPQQNASKLNPTA